MSVCLSISVCLSVQVCPNMHMNIHVHVYKGLTSVYVFFATHTVISTCRFIDPLTKKQHEARVAFQVRIRPKSYTKGKLTIKFSGQIDDKFLNNEIEWATKERGAVILYGLLTKIENP